MNINKWLINNTDSLYGKTVAITGSTGGLGKEICKYLAHLGTNLILLDRNRIKSENHGTELIKDFPDISIKYITVDLSDINSVKKACEILNSIDLDILILNAGVYNIPRIKCSTGFDNIFQVNFVSQYYLSYKILPKLREKNGKIIAVGSIAHFMTKIKNNDIELLNCKNSEKIYGNSKRFLMYSLYDMAEKENDIKINIVHPGITYTNLMSNYPAWISQIIKYPMKNIFMSPEKAALSVIKGIFTECKNYEWIGPEILGIWGKPKQFKLKKLSESETVCIHEVISTTVKI